jgi:4-carboxymuconolactone decarboxylase
VRHITAHRRTEGNPMPPPPTPPPATPRIPPLAPDERDEQATDLLAQVGTPVRAASNLFATLVRHPGLFRRWLPFGGKLLSGRLPDRDRELLILRTAWLCGSDYEWGQHQPIAHAAGVTADEIERLRRPDAADDPGWAPFDATLVRAADELHSDNRLADATWDQLAARYDERRLIEVPMLVGHYHLLAFTLSSLGVQLESDASGT